LENEPHYGISLGQDCFKQVLWLNGLVAASTCQFYGFLDNLLCFDSKIVEIHMIVSPSYAD
jgi:hypothetical protein